MTISTLRPVPRPRDSDPTHVRAGALRADESYNVALVANGKPNSMELLDARASHLAARVDVREVRRYRKPSVSVAPTDDDMAEIAEWAHAVLTAVGD